MITTLIRLAMPARAHARVIVPAALAAVLAVAGPVAAASTHVLHAFDGVDGSMPASALVEGPDGWLYGTTPTSGEGGYSLDGLIYRVSRSGTFEVIHRFDRCDPAGYNPLAALIVGGDGMLYGTTSRGGQGNECVGSLDTRNGTVFQLDPATKAVTTLHTFATLADGARPTAALVEARDGALYGTTAIGGNTSQSYPLGHGTIFRLTTDGSFSVLRRLDGCDGRNPQAPLALGADGRLYGTTNERRCVAGSGTGVVFRISTAGAFTQLHVFQSADGAQPRGRLVQAPNGLFYGVTERGGAYQHGVVYRISASGTFELLQQFGADGGFATRGMAPADGLVIGADGFFYGTARFGGLPIESDRDGVIFRMNRAGTRLDAVKTFRPGPDDRGPIQPNSALLLARDGRLYGTTIGGPNRLGTLIRFAPQATARLSSVSVYPGEVWSGYPGSDSTTGYVILDGLAPAGGATVTLSTNRPDVISLPQSVRIPAGWSTRRFDITSSPQPSDVTVRITATYAGVTRRTTLNVYVAP